MQGDLNESCCLLKKLPGLLLFTRTGLTQTAVPRRRRGSSQWHLSLNHLWQGGWPWLGIATQPPTVLGHEFCGIVEEVGANVTRFTER
jgi:hypothetical protein